jgi:hypothetical protein
MFLTLGSFDFPEANPVARTFHPGPEGLRLLPALDA